VRLEIGIQTKGLRQPLKTALQTAARLGARGVEIDLRRELPAAELSQTGVRQLRKFLEDFGLKVCAVGFPTNRGYNVPDELDRRVAATKHAMQMAYALGAPVVVNHVGRIPESEDDEDFSLLIEVLTDLGRHGQMVGCTLAAETGAESGEHLGRLIDALPDGSLAVDFNPGNLIVNGFSPLDALSVLGPHVRHAHAKDGVRDLARGRGGEVELGRGSVDFPFLLAALEDHAYRGFLTVERTNAVDPIAEFGNAVNFLRNVGMG
jgi:sugar phosphate isomerase/epimerase